ncbi:MAG: glycosyltransferase family 4 protein [Planctomycetes bacterium]|nr:glycosyltransferase family 4 protein [Planctomycetota bacterium]
MKILYICGINLNQNFAGTVRVLNTAKHLAQNGNTVHLLAPGFDASGLQGEGFRIHFAPTTNIRFLRTALFILLFPLYYLVLMLKLRPDAVYERELALIPLSPLTRILFRTKHFMELNGFLPGDLPSGIKRSLVILNEKLSFMNASALIASSKGLITGYTGKYQLTDKPVYVYVNSADEKKFFHILKYEVCNKTGLAVDYRYIATTGSFYSHHGLDLLVTAAPEVISKHPKVRFLLVGDGPARKGVEQLIAQKKLQDYFILTGSVKHAEIPFYINASDICVSIDTRYPRGNTPTKVPEYMACGKALLVSDNIEYEEIRQCGIAIPVDDKTAQSIADALNKMLADNVLLEKYGQNSLAAARNRYSYAITVKKLNDFLSA